MRIGLNGLFLQQPMTGSGQYTKNLLSALAELDQSNDYLVIGPSDSSNRAATQGHPCDTRAFEFGPGKRQFRSVEANTPFYRLSKQLGKVWFEQFGVPGVCSTQNIDLVHYPYFAAPLTTRCKTVVTIHDVIPLLLDPYRGSALVRLYMRLVSTAAKRATAIITDSESSKSDIVRTLRIPPERIAVIYLAVDQAFKVEADAGALSQARRKYGLNEDFILYMGGLDYRKNVVSLVAAFAEVRKHLDSSIQLAIAGQLVKGNQLFPDIERAAQEWGIEGAVVFLGPVAENDRPTLYSAAKVFVFPSLYEGFGLPPLEAMACGTPVICSNGSSLPEVVGDAAVVFDPARPKELVQAMLEVLTKDDLRAELRRRGLKRVAQFSWMKTAQETLRVYEAVADNRRIS